jgi:nitric oxide reductase NorE protein
MSAASPAVRPAPHLPGEVGIWVFIFGDLMVFGVMFATFTFYRSGNPELYLTAQRTLNQNIGAINTLLLLTSSWFVATAVNAARQGQTRAAPRLFGLAMLCGAGFIFDKYLEYSEKFRVGIRLDTNDFFMYYFVLTGIHLFHVLLGMGVLTVLCMKSRRPLDQSGISLMESGATFWHLVDLLWIMLFPLLYLMQ